MLVNQEYEKRLEAEIDRALKGLPEMAAPRLLVSQVMAALQQRARLPWYRQSWQMWPLPLRVVSLLVLLAVFGALCFAGWKLPHTTAFAAAMHSVSGWFSGAATLWHALNVLAGALVLTVKHFGTGFMIACLAAVALGYAMCVSLGTVYVRLGLARR
jgi:hypothetical protein